MTFSMDRPVTATFRPYWAAAASDDLLDAVDVGGEGGDDDALLAALELASKVAPTVFSRG